MRLDLGEWMILSWRQGDEAALVQHANNRNIWLNFPDAFPHPYTAPVRKGPGFGRKGVLRLPGLRCAHGGSLLMASL